MLFKEWLDVYLEETVKVNVKERSYIKYKIDIYKHIIPVLGNYELEEISEETLKIFLDSLNQKGLAATTINGVISILKNSLKTAFYKKLIDKNPSYSLIRPQIKINTFVYFTKSEQKKIENYVLKNNTLKYFGFVIGFYTGIRLGELLSLKWSDVDFDNNTISISKTCRDAWRNGKYFKILENLSFEASNRVIPVPETIMKKLREYSTDKNDDFLIPAKSEYGMEIRSYQRLFDSLLKKLDLEHKPFIAIRYTFVIRALEYGIDIQSLSEILGQKNMDVTLKKYIFEMPKRKDITMKKLDKLFKN